MQKRIITSYLLHHLFRRLEEHVAEGCYVVVEQYAAVAVHCAAVEQYVAEYAAVAVHCAAVEQYVAVEYAAVAVHCVVVEHYAVVAERSFAEHYAVPF